MKNQVKVSTTQRYSDSQGTHIVHRAKLVLVETHQHGGRIAWTPKKEWSTSILTGIPHDPIIISETEEIEEGDTITDGSELFEWDNELKRFLALKHSHINNKGLRTYIELDETRDFHKVLTLPDQLSDKHLQAIAGGKMKEGEVLVKCEMDGNHSDYQIFIYLDQQNHVTLFPAKQSLEEAREASWKQSKKWIGDTKDKLSHHAGFNAAVKWVKKNNY